MVTKIISGGQTGADRAALDWALARGVAIGGWCPAGRRSEDGEIPSIYPLRETPSKDYLVRTRLNVRDSDATLIATSGAKLTRGSLRTKQFCEQLGRPFLHIQTTAEISFAACAVREFCAVHRVLTLNVAGSRESKSPGIGEFVRSILETAFSEASDAEGISHE